MPDLLLELNCSNTYVLEILQNRAQIRNSPPHPSKKLTNLKTKSDVQDLTFHFFKNCSKIFLSPTNN
jgi:hypothetical protein